MGRRLPGMLSEDPSSSQSVIPQCQGTKSQRTFSAKGLMLTVLIEGQDFFRFVIKKKCPMLFLLP